MIEYSGLLLLYRGFFSARFCPVPHTTVRERTMLFALTGTIVGSNVPNCLLVPQGRHGIDAERASGWYQRSQNRNYSE
jgi:hypothetical protein